MVWPKPDLLAIGRRGFSETLLIRRLQGQDCLILFEIQVYKRRSEAVKLVAVAETCISRCTICSTSLALKPRAAV